ncbi:hypothetical protein AAHB94_16665 [Bacillus toyonensis]
METEMDLEGISKLLELDINLPNKQFEMRKEFTRNKYDLKSDSKYDNQFVNDYYKPFSYALTKTNELNMTV